MVLWISLMVHKLGALPSMIVMVLLTLLGTWFESASKMDCGVEMHHLVNVRGVFP